MTAKLPNIVEQSKQLSDGSFRVYAYMGRGGEKLCAADGRTRDEAIIAVRKLITSPDIISRYAELRNAKPVHSADTSNVFGLVSAFFASPEFKGLSKSSQRDHRRYLEDFREKFGHYNVRLFGSPKIVQCLAEWRDERLETPRAADNAMASVKRLFSWARSRGFTNAEPAKDLARLYKGGNRADKTWSDEQIKKISEAGSPQIAYAVQLASLTGLRQGDLLKLSWSAISDNCITLMTSKRKRQVVIPLLKQTKALLKKIPKVSTVVLTNAYAEPWSADGFRSSFNSVKQKAAIEDLRFHDLRGTAATFFHRAGLTNADIARVMGWSESSVESMISLYVDPNATTVDMLNRMKQKRRPTN